MKGSREGKEEGEQAARGVSGGWRERTGEEGSQEWGQLSEGGSEERIQWEPERGTGRSRADE